MQPIVARGKGLVRRAVVVLVILWGALVLAIGQNIQPMTAQSRANYEILLQASYSDIRERQLWVSLHQAIFIRINDPAFTELPPDMGQLPNLQRLDLENTAITVLSPDISQLSDLQVLDVSHTGLTALPPEIGQLTHLQGLYLGNTALTALPPELGQLVNLQGLYLGDTTITALPPEIVQLANLQLLDLSNTQIIELPAGLEANPNLTIYLDGTTLAQARAEGTP
jgi:hypothetical protein